MSPSTRVRAGLALAAFLGVGDVVSAFFPTPDGEVGPPLAIVLLGGLLRGGHAGRRGHGLAHRPEGALRVVAGTRVLSAVAALPAFFVDGVPALFQLLAAISVVLTVVCVVLVLAPARRDAEIVD